MYNYSVYTVVARHLDRSYIQRAQELFHAELVHASAIGVDSFYAARYGDGVFWLFCADPYAAVDTDCDVKGEPRAEEREKEMAWVEEPVDRNAYQRLHSAGGDLP